MATAVSPMCGHDAPQASGCPVCAIALRNPDYVRAWWPRYRGPLAPPKPRMSFDERAALNRKISRCQQAKAAGRPCTEFSQPAKVTLVTPKPLRTLTLNPYLQPGQAFNPSIAYHDGTMWLAYRLGWTRSRIVLCRLDPATLLPLEPGRLLQLGRLAEDGPAQEDPRLFVHNDRLHVAFTGYAPGPRGWYTTQCVARLSQGGTVEQSWACRYERRQAWEKNWGFFSHEGDLFAVHTIAPHRVLHLTPDGVAHPFAETPWSPTWAYGAMRGGAPPVRVGDEYWSFFHGRQDNGHASLAVYAGGVYAFEARPPFRPTRVAVQPLLYPVASEKKQPHTPSVCYPAGAVPLASMWLVAYGYHDHYVRVAEFDAGTVGEMLP